MAAERPPRIRLRQFGDEVTDLGEAHDPTVPTRRRVIGPVWWGVAGWGRGEPSGVTEPSTHRAYRRDDGVTPRACGTQRVDDPSWMLPRGEPSFRFGAKLRPGVGPGAGPGRRAAFRDATKVCREGGSVACRQGPGGPPHPGQLPREHPALVEAQVRVASMLLAERDTHPVRQVVECDPPDSGACAQCAHRLGRPPPPLCRTR